MRNKHKTCFALLASLLLLVILLSTGPPAYADNWDEYRLWSYMPVDKLDIFVHRKPICMFSFSLSPIGNPPTSYNINITSNAYDLDHQSQPDKGIVEHKWDWKPVTSTTWNTGKPTSLAANNNYLIRYRVKDYEGVWSDPQVALISTSNTNLPPIAQFMISPNPVVVDKLVTITDLSYDPNGDALTGRQWRTKSPSGSWSSTATTPPTSFGSVGNWLVELRVCDSYLGTVYSVAEQKEIDFTGEGGSYAFWNPNYAAPANYTIETIEFRTAVADDDYFDQGKVEGYKNGVWYTIKTWRKQARNSAVSDVLNVSGQGYTQVRFSFRMYDEDDSAKGDPDGSYYKITLKTTTTVNTWSDPYYQTVTVIPENQKPVARFTVSPNPGYDYNTYTYNDTSYDPDGDPIVAREWRINSNGGASWQTYTNPPTNFQAGTYKIQLRVMDQPRYPQQTAMWSDWYEQTLTVQSGFYVTGTIVPNPAERGRKIKITAEARKLSDNTLTTVDSMIVTIPNPTKPGGGSSLPAGQNPVQATMTYNPATGTYTYEYLIPEKSQAGYWPDDGNYYIKITGTKGTVTKEALVPLQIKGHVLRRVIIQTTEW